MEKEFKYERLHYDCQLKEKDMEVLVLNNEINFLGERLEDQDDKYAALRNDLVNVNVKKM